MRQPSALFYIDNTNTKYLVLFEYTRPAHDLVFGNDA